MNQTSKIIKYVAIALAVFIIVGIFSFLSSLINIFYDLNSNSINNDIYKYENINDVKELYFKINSSNLVIKNSDKFKIETNNKRIYIKHDKSKLTITEKKYNLNKNSKIIIYLPNDYIFSNVDITSGAGKISINYLNTKSLKLNLGAGTLEVDDIYVENKASIETGAGEVKIKKSVINNLNLNCGVGEINLNTILIGTNKITAGIGEIKLNLLDDKNNYTIFTKKGIGQIKIDEKIPNKTTIGDGKNTLSIEGGIGEIDIKFD